MSDRCQIGDEGEGENEGEGEGEGERPVWCITRACHIPPGVLGVAVRLAWIGVR